MLVKTQAIIFRAYKYGETSLIVEAYTEQMGLRKYIVSGVRKANAKVGASLLQPMSQVQLVAYERADRDLHRIKEIRAAYHFQQLPFDVRKGTVGLFMVEVARKAIREEEQNLTLFQFLQLAFQWLDATPHSFANLHLTFLLELAEHLGFAPAEGYGTETPIFDLLAGDFVGDLPDHPNYLTDQEAQALAKLLAYSMHTSHELAFNRSVRQRLLDNLVLFFQIHLEGIGEIHTHQILRDVF